MLFMAVISSEKFGRWAVRKSRREDEDGKLSFLNLLRQWTERGPLSTTKDILFHVEINKAAVFFWGAVYLNIVKGHVTLAFFSGNLEATNCTVCTR